MSQQQQAPIAKRCHYEVLEVGRKATDSELKKAYRKLALKWHPDKNIDNAEEANLRFKELQFAYSVVSDPQERAWYDNHRDIILRGDDGSDDDEDCIDVRPFMSKSCYNGYGDDANSFFTVYRDLFERLGDDEDNARDASESEAEGAPLFGDASSDYADVKLFYNFWLNFSSRKGFYSAEKYNPAQAPNRQVKRLMEQDNKKERTKLKRAYTDRVRKLAQYVRDRDVRVQRYQVKVSKEKEEKARLEETRRKEAEEEKRAKMKEWQQEREAEMLVEEERMREEGLLSDEEEEEEEVETMYCVACKKRFRNEKQWHNHEKSKKHKEIVALLREELEREDEILREYEVGNAKEEEESEASEENVGDEASNVTPAADDGHAYEDDDSGDLSGSDVGDVEPKPVTAPRKRSSVPSADEDLEDEDELLMQFVSASASRNKKKKNKNKKKNVFTFDDLSQAMHDDTSSDDDDAGDSGGVQAGSSSKAGGSGADAESSGEGDKSDSEKEDKEEAAQSSPSPVVEEDSDSDDGRKRRGKKSSRKDKRKEAAAKSCGAARASATSHPEAQVTLDEEEDGIGKRGKRNKSKKEKKGASQQETGLSCKVCSTSFPSRNQLFSHIKETGHATVKKR